MRDNLNRGNNMRETVEASPSVTPIRRDYATPMLAVYGNLADLTATGSGTASESGGAPSDMQCETIYKMHKACG